MRPSRIRALSSDWWNSFRVLPTGRAGDAGGSQESRRTLGSDDAIPSRDSRPEKSSLRSSQAIAAFDGVTTMLDLLCGTARNCERVDRRAFLKIGSLGGLGISLPLLLAHQQALAKAGNPESKATKPVNCIFIWTLGGTSHHDTLDPQPEASASVKGPFGVIDTAVAGVKFAEVCPRLAQELNRYSVLRSWNP